MFNYNGSVSAVNFDSLPVLIQVTLRRRWAAVTTTLPLQQWHADARWNVWWSYLEQVATIIYNGCVEVAPSGKGGRTVAHVTDRQTDWQTDGRPRYGIIDRSSPRLKVKKGISSSWTSSHCYEKSHNVWDHTMLPATRQRWFSRLYPSGSWYSI